MFDVRPVKADGSLDMNRIKGLKRTAVIGRERKDNLARNKQKRISDLKKSYTPYGEIAPLPKKSYLSSRKKTIEKQRRRRANAIQMGKVVPYDCISISKVPEPPAAPEDHFEPETKPKKEYFQKTDRQFLEEKIIKKKTEIDGFFRPEDSPSFSPSKESEIDQSADNILSLLEDKKPNQKIRRKRETDTIPFPLRLKYIGTFASVLAVFSLALPGMAYLQKGFDMEARITESGQAALSGFVQAQNNLSSGQFGGAAANFEESYQILSEAKEDISSMGGKFSEVLRFIPGISKVASANYVLAAGENLALAGKNISESTSVLGSFQNPLSGDSTERPSLTEIFLNLQKGIEKANNDMKEAEENINKVNIDDLPDEMKPQFLTLKEKLPVITSNLENFLDYSEIFLDVLGYHGQRKFLFLFQNNQEMRATGGFIGSYGILDIRDGRIKNLFVDNIYNPDGQLQARVIPPEPIQKMSAVWTMHDANWFPDFPTSAEKVSLFYEKTGGPTVDGVVAITPNLIQNLLEITGPIEMPEYGTTVDARNFIEKTQYEVEVDYDKEENRPKKFIADLTPKVLDEVLNAKDVAKIVKTLSALNEALREKHLLLYSKNYNIQNLISKEGWSGEILNTPKDYLSVINTNINGYKTDGVIDENIRHQIEIQSDGSIVDTVEITRVHKGGNEKYDWWNKVNGDWMRVYVPEGSALLEAEGQTREFVSPPLDYNSLNFKADPQVEANRDSLRTDEETGTKIYTENRKTVFANWVYVSPGESVTMRYKYRLPFQVKFDNLHHPADSFSVLYQKQSGSQGSRLDSKITLPDSMKTVWHWPESVNRNGNTFQVETILNADKYVGMAIERK